MISHIQRLTKNLSIAIPVALAMGLVFGLLFPADGLRALIVPLTFLMVFPMMVGLKLGQLAERGGARLQLTAQALNFAVIPFVAYLLGKLFFPDQPFAALGLLLAALLPTSGMTISWTGMAGGNLPAAIKMTVLGLILGSLAAPFYLLWLIGAEVPIALGTVFLQIGVVVALPLAAGQATRIWLLHKHGQAGFQKIWAPKFPPFSTLGVLGIAFVAMALQAQRLAANPGELVLLIMPLLLLYLFNFTLSTLVGRAFFPRGDGIALVYGTVMRNLSIALALAMNVFGPAGTQAALVIALAYVVQVQSAAWYVKLTDHVFGPKP